jgi:hypothetical protein
MFNLFYKRGESLLSDVPNELRNFLIFLLILKGSDHSPFAPCSGFPVTSILPRSPSSPDEVIWGPGSQIPSIGALFG